jgi:hypothetical protein
MTPLQLTIQTLGDHLTFASACEGCELDFDTEEIIICTIESLAAGDTQSYLIGVSVGDVANGTSQASPTMAHLTPQASCSSIPCPRPSST